MSMYNELDKMIKIAKAAHEGQMYGNKPYTHHLENVEDVYLDLFIKGKRPMSSSLHDLAAVWGHDLIEDTSITAGTLLDNGISKEVVGAILHVTKVKSKDYSYKGYLRNIATNPLAWQVKVADTYSNMTESMKDCNFKRTKKYAKQLELLYKFKEEEDLK